MPDIINTAFSAEIWNADDTADLLSQEKSLSTWQETQSALITDSIITVDNSFYGQLIDDLLPSNVAVDNAFYGTGLDSLLLNVDQKEVWLESLVADIGTVNLTISTWQETQSALITDSTLMVDNSFYGQLIDDLLPSNVAVDNAFYGTGLDSLLPSVANPEQWIWLPPIIIPNVESAEVWSMDLTGDLFSPAYLGNWYASNGNSTGQAVTRVFAYVS